MLRLQTYQVQCNISYREKCGASSSNFLLHILVFCFQRFNYLIIETTWVWIHRRPSLLALIFLATHLAVQNWSHFPPSLGNLFYVTPQHSLLGYLFKGICARRFHKEFPAVMHSAEHVCTFTTSCQRRIFRRHVFRPSQRTSPQKRPYRLGFGRREEIHTRTTGNLRPEVQHDFVLMLTYHLIMLAIVIYTYLYINSFSHGY